MQWSKLLMLLPLFSHFLGVVMAGQPVIGNKKRECIVLINERKECGYFGITKEICEQISNCCWSPTPESRKGTPWCFAARDLKPHYAVQSVNLDQSQRTTILKHLHNLDDSHSADSLEMIERYQEDIVNIRIRAPNHDIVPEFLYQSIEGYPMPYTDWNPTTRHLMVDIKTDPFQFAVRRWNEQGAILFSTEARHETDPFDSIIYKDLYVEIGTRLGNRHFIYGLGERVSRFRRQPRRMAFNARDTPAKKEQNSYGSHPFYLEMRPDGHAHGVLMLNSHPMEVELTEDSLIYRMIGGVIDLYVFAGPTPDAVIEQYTRTIGRPPLYHPRFLGFHQCRYGYDTLDKWREIVRSFDEHRLPIDGIWFDIDYLDNYDIFTVSPGRFPLEGLRDFIREQESRGRMSIVIIDPGVSIKEGLPAYAEGKKADLFIRAANGQGYYEGYVWPGPVHFVDFFSPKSSQYWYSLIASFYQIIPFKGLWLDMCEPASFQSGHRDTLPLVPDIHSSDPNYPPFAINNGDGELDIFIKTINMDAIHVDGTKHLALHNAYGLAESFRTGEALEKLEPGKRHFLLTRSTFPGSGRFTAHWLGDNFSDFEHMKYSIAGLLDFQLFGIPMVGADICGFLQSTDEELCARWMELGAFYPFARNHNAEKKEFVPQEPYQWPIVAEVTRRYFSLRYSLLPYWYTLLHFAHESGRPMIRPLFFEFPGYPELLDVDEQFMVGSSLLVVPVLTRGANTVECWLPPGIWYDLMNFQSRPILSEKPHRVTLNADIYTLPVLLRGGSVILRQRPELTIRDTLLNPYELFVALDLQGFAQGYVYFDDGETSNPDNAVTELFIKVLCRKRTCNVKFSGQFGYEIVQPIASIVILAPDQLVGSSARVRLGNRLLKCETKISQHVLTLQHLNLKVNQAFTSAIVMFSAHTTDVY